MATALSLYTTSNISSSGQTIYANQLNNGKDHIAILVFNKLSVPIKITKAYPQIGSVKVGGQTLATEELSIKYEFGYWNPSNSAFASFSSFPATKDTVSEKDGTVSSSVTISCTSNFAFLEADKHPAVRVTFDTNKSGTGVKAVVSGFALSIDYTVYDYTVTTVASPTEGGIVLGGGTYDYGSKPTLTATPNTGYKFVKWSDEVTTATRTITVTGNATYTAIFEKLPPVFTSASMTYLNKQISQSNKVICNEGFIISVGVT